MVKKISLKKKLKHYLEQRVDKLKIMKKVNIAIIGFGFMGKVYAHAANTLKDFFPDSPDVEVSAILVSKNKTISEIKSIQNRYKIRKVTNKIDDLLNDSSIDAFYIATPNDLHYEHVKLALARNKHVLCDKPMGLNISETKHMLELANAKKKIISNVVFQYRFLPCIVKIKNMIDLNHLGDIIQFRFMYLHGSYIDERPITWRLKKGTGGALVDLGPHVFDLINFLLGDFKINFAKKKSKIKDRDVDDAAWILCQTNNAADGYVELSRVSTGSIDDLRLEIHGTKGAVKWNLEDLNYLHFFDKTSDNNGYVKLPVFTNNQSDFPPPKVTSGWIQSHINCLYNFVKEISDDSYKNKNAAKFKDGHKVQKQIEKIITI